MSPKKVVIIILAVIAAVFIWFHVVTERVYTYTFSFSVRTTGNVAKNFVLASELPESLQVVINGRGKDLISQFQTKGEIIIDLNKLSYGKKTINLKEEKAILASPKLTVVNIKPSSEIEIVLDRLKSMEVPVISKLKIIPETGFVVSSELVFSPEKVIIYGPEKQISEIDEVYTVQETLANFNISTSKPIPLEMISKLIHTSTETVIVSIEIEELSEKSLAEIPIVIRKAPSRPGYTIPRSAKVKLSGPKSMIDKLAAKNIEVYFYYQEYSRKNNGIVQLKVDVPKPIQVILLDPEEVKFVPRKISTD